MIAANPNEGVHARTDDPILSVIIPTHDVEPWIDELLESVLASGLTSTEVIVVDDHSTDGTLDRLAELAASDPRVHVVRAHQRGGARARNTGLAVARGRYVVFVDGDDIVPPGAHERLVAALERSGSDIAFGDWLKFSSVRTWQPSRNWKVFDQERLAVSIGDVPALIRGRAVWNKVFRRAFLEELGLEFPEVARSNDILPMTRAYLAARSIDVLPDCVYLYRDRPGTGSMTSRAGADAAAVSYFTQEGACAALIAAHGEPAVSRTYSSLLFDADAWLHLSRFLSSVPAERVRSSGALDAVQGLIAAAPRAGLAIATPHKQVLWCLTAVGAVEAARRFNEAEESARAADRYEQATFEAWVDALEIIDDHPGVLPEVSRSRLLTEGLATVLVHHARDLSCDEVDALTARVAASGLFDTVEVSALRRGPARRVAEALRDGTPGAVWLVSTSVRERLVVDDVQLDGGGAVLTGPEGPISRAAVLSVVLRRQGGPDVRRLRPVESDGRWSVTVPSSVVGIGRWDVVGEYVIGDASVEVPVVTDRMPLPVPNRADLVRVLADRSRSWRVVLERRRAVAVRAALTVVRRVARSR